MSLTADTNLPVSGAVKTLLDNTGPLPLSINVHALLTAHYPAFNGWPIWFQNISAWCLEKLIHQDRLNLFLKGHSQLKPVDFIEAVFDELQFKYRFNSDDLRHIPQKGPVIIFANHPLGGLDGLSLLHLIHQVRPDVKIVANQLLSAVTPLASLLLPVNNMTGATKKSDLNRIKSCLESGQAVVFFPAGEVSRLTAKGIHDKKWDAGFLRFAEQMRVPILPIFIKARNSGLFYALSRISSGLSMLMLVHEMLRFRGELRFQPLSVIDSDELAELRLATPQKLRLLQKHLYRMGKGGKPVIRVKAPIIQAQDRQRLAHELKGAEKLGKTVDQKTLLLCDLDADSSVLHELGRLREIAFRAVGEGTGQSKDTDDFDLHYRHIIVWDETTMEIAGAYRFAEVWKWPEQAEKKLYSSGLFEFSQAGKQIFGSGMELGRSFVQPQFWGQRSLDYLWQGIGAYLACHPHIRYLFGPVSLSARLPVRARDMLIWHYGEHYRSPTCLAEPRNPFYLRQADRDEMNKIFFHRNVEDEFAILREQLRHLNVKVPTLYRQYAEICHPGGVSFSAFNVDAKFSLCLDSLVCVDLNLLKPQKYDRYIRPFLTKEETTEK